MTTAETNSAMGTKPFVPPMIEPDPKADKAIGFIRAIVSNPVSAMPTAVYSQPITISDRTGKSSAFICDPAAVEEILVKRPHDFPKSMVDDRVLRSAFGDSLITAHNESWRWKRRLAAPHFTPAALKTRLPVMVRPFEQVTREIAKPDQSSPVDMSGRMMATTLEVIADTLFTSSDELDMQAVSEAITDYLAPIPWTVTLASFRLPEWFPHAKRNMQL
jgi:cytochrome P450